MKKILIALCLTVFASSALASTIYCPAYAICTNGGKDCRLPVVGIDWKTDTISNRDGKFIFKEASETQPIIYCVYKIPSREPGEKDYNLFFISTKTGFVSDINAIGNRWQTASKNRGCNSSNPLDCPFTSVNVVK